MTYHREWDAQTSITIKSSLNLKSKLTSSIFQVKLNVN
jgi:hypothetical protein